MGYVDAAIRRHAEEARRRLSIAPDASDDMVLFVDAIRRGLGLPEGVDREQVLDAVQAVRQATPDAIVRGCNELHAQMNAADIPPGIIGAPNSFERLRERVTMALATRSRRRCGCSRAHESVPPPGWAWRSVRDESVPPPGVTLQRCTPHGNPGVQIHYDDGLGLVAGVQCHLGDIVAEEDVPEVLRLLWRKYEREHGYAPPAAEVKAETVTFAVGDWVTVPVDTKVPNIDKVIRAGTIGEVLLVGGSPENGEEIHVSFASDQCWWMTASTLQKTAKANRAPTYAEVLEAAAAAKREIEAEWPAWKKAIR